MSGATTIDRDEAIRLLQMANLPLKVKGLTPKDFGGRASIVLDYVRSSAYANDQSAGRGVCLSGDASIRSDLLALIAKPFALDGRRTWFCSVHYLVNVLEYGSDDDRGSLNRCEHLFVDWFEKDFGNEGCPYTLFQRTEVEEFLSARLRAGEITNFAACFPWDRLTWWSRDFISLFAPMTESIHIG